MLGLKLATDPRWVDIAEKSIDEVLIDHAFCEQKAASTCISLIVNYPDKKRLVEELAPIVTEEWGHFRMVLSELEKRGYELGQQRKDEYVLALAKCIRKGGSRDQYLVERLLMSALIEARSCERFRLLSLHISDDSLKEFYHNLMVAEANHYTLFLELAKEYMPEEYVKQRFQEFLDEEAEILSSLELRGDRVH